MGEGLQSASSLDVEVKSRDGSTLMSSSGIAVEKICTSGGRIGAFEIAPPNNEIILSIIPHGVERACLRGIDVVADDWPFQTAELIISSRRQFD